MELDLDPAVFVGPNLFPCFAYNRRGLGALDKGLWRYPRRTVGDLGVYGA